MPAPWVVSSKHTAPAEKYELSKINPETKAPERWCFSDGIDYILKARCLYGTPSFRRIYVSKAKWEKIHPGDIFHPDDTDEYTDRMKLEIKDEKGKVLFKNEHY